MTDISVVSTAYQVEKRSWLLSAHGTDPGTNPNITLDVSAFTANTHYPNGYLLSGTPLAKVGNLYVPYAGSPTEVQTIAIDATGGTFTVTVDGSTTAAVAWNATAVTLQAALEALTNVNVGDVTVTKASNTFTVSFVGQFLGDNVPVMTTNAGSLTGGAGTATVATTTGGGPAASDGSGVGMGLLVASVKVPNTADTTKDVGGGLLVHGFVRESKLPLPVDAAFKAACPLIYFS